MLHDGRQHRANSCEYSEGLARAKSTYLSTDDEKYKAWSAQRKAHLEGLTAALLFPKIRQGDRGALASAITLVESEQIKHRTEAYTLLNMCLPHSGTSWRIGITGVPGVGKSTFIEQIGKKLIEEGHRLAVMAIDPSSSISGGSIMGDKTRMETLSMHQDVFIRPTPTGKTLGGVAQHTREAIILCEAAGYDVVLVETVGVGQSETMVHGMVDFFLLLMLSGAGDELQGIKRGIMEMADGILITKADQGNEGQAKQAKLTYQNALHLLSSKAQGWTPQVDCISSIEARGMEIPIAWWKKYFDEGTRSGYLKARRRDQDLHYFEERIQQKIAEFLVTDQRIAERYQSWRKQISEGKCSPQEAAHALFEQITQKDGRI
ncbi:MAG: methylmalonyl Co-A mutase-associated GTPase MeaB [Flavobacteriia bacterium]|nr:methylmalonyl Co-A mutase-associated GTPase MeaB [Flavobacteriia bacterium]